jgi:RND family efflux transporter MFP subunit
MSAHTRELTPTGRVFKILVPLLILLGGGAAWLYYMETAPIMEKKIPSRLEAVVETQSARVEDAGIRISAMGTVTAARTVTLKAQVAGAVLETRDALVPGSLVAEGETLLVLDPADYRVALQKAQSALASAKAALAIEQGNQNIAREEVRVLGQISPGSAGQTDLALRKPQLAQAQATVASAEADLAQARLNLDRTRINAPFEGMIVDRSVAVGSYVGAQEELVTLAGTDEFWIEAVVPLDVLPLIDASSAQGSPVHVRSQAGTGTWEGRVLQVRGSLGESSRMASVIVAVPSPLGTRELRAPTQLMLDDYVHVEIEGRALAGVVKLPRSAVRDKDTVWIDADGILDIRTVSMAWKDQNHVYVRTGIAPGEHVIISDLATPVQGMAVTMAEAQEHLAQNSANATRSNL